MVVHRLNFEAGCTSGLLILEDIHRAWVRGFQVSIDVCHWAPPPPAGGGGLITSFIKLSPDRGTLIYPTS
jgi:hypothetical protein